jgi:putative transcriptional regulator
MERGFTIHNHVRLERVKRKMKQQELAKFVGVTRQTIGLIEIERYNPTLALAFRLAQALETQVDELFWMEDASHAHQK